MPLSFYDTGCTGIIQEYSTIFNRPSPPGWTHRLKPSTAAGWGPHAALIFADCASRRMDMLKQRMEEGWVAAALKQPLHAGGPSADKALNGED